MTRTRDPYITPARRLPALDGIRGVAILLVVLSHADMAEGTQAIEWLARLGDFGVKLFFVLSGFLITTLLVTEHRRTGSIAIGRFVIRRAFRISGVDAVSGQRNSGWRSRRNKRKNPNRFSGE